MKITASSTKIAAAKADVIAVFSYANDEKRIKAIDACCNGAASKAFAKKLFVGNAGETMVADATGMAAEKTFAVGLGERQLYTAEVLRRACGMAASYAQSRGYKTLAIELPEGGDAAANAQAAVEASIMSTYAFDKYKSKEPNTPERQLQEVIVLSADKDAEAGAKRGQLVGETVNFVRAVDNEPANVATPEWLARQAMALTGGNLKVLSYDKKDLERMGAGGLLAVNSGSDKEPRMVVMEWNGGKKGGVCFVGKGITFDSGGISIKPAGDMDKMKFDKSGACAVIGIMKAVKESNYPGRVVGIFVATENIPGSGAYKPGDIVRAMNGKTIEVLNTDAEGRIVLADALSMAAKQNVDTIIDLATLTGAVSYALGDLACGLMHNDEKLCGKLRAAGDESGERCWPFPNWPEYDEKVKSDFADVKNIGEPGSAGTIAGASFLKLFIGTAKWAHLDIAGTAWNAKPKAYMGLGATGAGVRICLEYLRQAQGK